MFPKGEQQGFGFHEAPRGTLSHWIVIENGKIKNYQAVVPSTWNAGPRDAKNQPGPYEASLVGNPVADAERPLEVHPDGPLVRPVHRVRDPHARRGGQREVARQGALMPTTCVLSLGQRADERRRARARRAPRVRGAVRRRPGRRRWSTSGRRGSICRRGSRTPTASILIDTVKAPLPPGSLRLYKKADLLRRAPGVRVSPHDPGVKETLLALEFAGRAPREVALIGVVPGRDHDGARR